MELEGVQTDIKWHVIGLAKVRRMEEDIRKLPLDHIVFHRGKGSERQSGGFLTNKALENNKRSFESISDRVAW